MRRYSAAPEKISSGVRMSRSSGQTAHCPSAAPSRPTASASSSTDRAMAGRSPVRLLPMRLAISTFAPIASPDDTVTISATISVFVPTAASAPGRPNRPTTAVSAALNSCCSILLSAMGSVNRISFLESNPCSISMSFRVSSMESLPFFACMIIAHLLE